MQLIDLMIQQIIAKKLLYSVRSNKHEHFAAR